MKLTLVHLKKNPNKIDRFDNVRIWSGEHKAWWGPNRRGYAVNVKDAGVYTIKEAWNSTSHCCKKKKIEFHSV